MVSAVRSVAPAANTSLAVQSARREAQQAEQTARALQSQAQALVQTVSVFHTPASSQPQYALGA